MVSPKPPPEHPGNGAAKEPSPIDRFRKLTKDLSHIGPVEVREAERREREERGRGNSAD